MAADDGASQLPQTEPRRQPQELWRRLESRMVLRLLRVTTV